MFNKITKSFQYGKHEVVLETGVIARQASGSVLVSIDGTVILATVVVDKNIKDGQDFFPLTVDYIEKTYAAGLIPGGFFKRESKPSEREILISRLIDRSLRPLFPKGFYNEVQVILHVLSVNPEINPDVGALIGASAALSLSGVPFDGPLGVARVGYSNKDFILNPTENQIPSSELDLIIAGSEDAVLMVESKANQLSESIMLDAIVFGHQKMQIVIESIHDLVAEAGKPEWNWQPNIYDENHIENIKKIIYDQMVSAYKIKDKQSRISKIQEIKNQAKISIKENTNNIFNSIPTDSCIDNIIFDIERSIVRNQILNGEPRIDGRDTRTVRPIDIKLGFLPRTHGSALFTRGETQALVVTTLGTKHDEQIVENIMGEYREKFIFHYNMPPFATGEVGRIGVPKRREIGHGYLAKKALESLIPESDNFQYTIRLVSEITESNGSSSMASVCGASLSMMDAGIPLKSPVAGVAMGLILEKGKFAILTDILGDEDHLGDMDFKVAGTDIGITALQMDIKIHGINKEIMKIALDQAKDGRLHILNIMNNSINSSRSSISNFAPKMVKININPEKIRDVIGKGGATIRLLTEETGAQIDISDNGTILISSNDEIKLEQARKRILEISSEVEVGKVYDGQILRLLDFGAIVQVMPGKDGLLHISEISHNRITNINDILVVNQKIKVKVIDSDDKGRIRLSAKALESRKEKDK